MKRTRQQLTPDQLLKRRQSALKRKIRSIFTGAGFEYVASAEKHFKIGLRTIEVDALFVFENIVLFCEDTCAGSKDKEHIRTKNEAFGQIKRNLQSYFDHLKISIPEKAALFQKYDIERYQVFFLYISESEIVLSEDERSLYSELIFVNPKTLNYFQWMVQSIKRSARYEVFRFLNLSNEKIGLTTSDATRTILKAPIIYPKAITGMKNKVRVVSFMISAEKLLETCYVLRKDNWEDSLYLYQRLIDKTKIKSIRNYLATKGDAFYNNIIVAMPDNTNFVDASGSKKTIDEIGDFESGCQLEVPNDINSICVIDGQHRIFAHYEGMENDRHEQKISLLRKQLHLLVTGLIFPPLMSAVERAQIQSEMFLDINSNAKPVPPDVLLQIETIKDPLSDIGIARRVIEKLNSNGVFFNMFEFSLLEGSKVKIASIIKFALRYLVTTTPTEGNRSLIDFWDGDKNALNGKDDIAYSSYIDFCANKIDTYFSAVKKNLKSAWESADSKLRSVIAINGFVIAFNRQLSQNGLQDFDFYDRKFKNWTYDFSKEDFPYTSSQYRKFSTVILREVFGIAENEGDINPN